MVRGCRRRDRLRPGNHQGRPGQAQNNPRATGRRVELASNEPPQTKGTAHFSHTKRSGGETTSTLKGNWNKLLTYALDACDPPIPSKGMTMTNIRHTAFHLTLEDAPELGQEPGIHAFATNGLTSTEMLRATYLRLIGEEATTKRTRPKNRTRFLVSTNACFAGG